MATSSPVETKSFLDRRSGARVSHHFTARFASDPNYPLRLSQGLTQDLSLRGVQLLMSVIPDPDKPFDIWIPLDDQEIISARGRVVWMSLEDAYEESSYWLRVGVNLSCEDPSARKLLADAISRKSSAERILREQETSKIGFVF